MNTEIQKYIQMKAPMPYVWALAPIQLEKKSWRERREDLLNIWKFISKKVDFSYQFYSHKTP
jgi:hypothetical protein